MSEKINCRSKYGECEALIARPVDALQPRLDASEKLPRHRRLISRKINEGIDKAGEEGRKLLARLQTEEMQRMEEDIADLTQQKEELEQQLAAALGKKPEEGKRGDGKDKKK